MADYTRQIDLAFATPGLDSIGKAEDALREVGAAQQELAKQFAAGAVGASDFVKEVTKLGREMDRLESFIAQASAKTDEYAQLQAKLGQMERDSAQAAQQGAAATVKAKQAGTAAVADHVRKLAEEKAAIEAARVADIAAIGARATAYARAERQMEAADAQRTAAASRFEDAIVAMNQAAVKGYASTATASAQATTGINNSGRAASQQSYAWLNLAYAVDDLQYGFSAILNNTPALVAAMGGGPGLAGTVLIAGVAFETARPKLAEFAKEIGLVADKSKGFALTIAEVEEKVKAITAKPIKFEADYKTIDDLNKRLDKAKEGLAAYEAAVGNKTKDQGTSSQIATEAATEAGGVAAIEQGFRNANPNLGAALNGANRLRTLDAYLKRFDDNTATFADRYQKAIYEAFHGSIEAERDTLRRSIKEGTEQLSRSAVGNAIDGKDPRARQQLEDALNRDPEAFRRAGVDVPKLLEGLVKADPIQIQEDRRMASGQANLADEFGRSQKEAKAKADADREAKRVADEADRTKKQADAKQHQDIMSAADRARQGAEQRENLAEQAAKPYEADVEGYLAGNELTYRTTGRLARSRRQEQQFAGQGLPYAVPQAEARRRATGYVGSQLAATGGDPTLAEGAVGAIVGKLGDDVRQGIAQGNGQVGTLIGIVGAVQSKVDRALADQQRNWAAIGMLRARQGKAGAQMPSITNF